MAPSESEQLDLFADPTPHYAVAMCASCGPVAKVPIEGGPGARWDLAEKWCYVALKNHDREVHGAS